MITLAGQLTVFMRDIKCWVVSPDITDNMVWKNQRTFKKYTSQTVGRQLRKLEESRILAVRDYGKTKQYKFIPEHLRSKYIPTSSRTDKDVLFSKT